METSPAQDMLRFQYAKTLDTIDSVNLVAYNSDTS